ncbi:MAG: glycoside hydrolase family 5 protein [Oscillospiraceae bacterium]|nr:glycoside hydrolase family 5 protein [Oscillospiraceae bacterium]
MRFRRITAAMLAGLLSAALLSGCRKQTDSAPAPEELQTAQTGTAGTDAPVRKPSRGPGPVYGQGWREDAAGVLRTADVVREMGYGISLGNTFDCFGSRVRGETVRDCETAWGSPPVTQQMIGGYAAEGFRTLRIPVSWSNMIQADNQLDPDYLARVHEVAGWALRAGMYVIVNLHRDGGWFDDFSDPSKKNACMAKYTRIWQQICTEFSGEGAHLLFESYGGAPCWTDLWDPALGADFGREDAYALLAEINQSFVRTVRNSGGGNTRRHLLITGYAAEIETACDPAAEMPSDPQDRCALAVHFSSPADFCVLEADTDEMPARDFWGGNDDLQQLQAQMDFLNGYCAARKIPAVITEFGCPLQNKEPDSVRQYLSAVCSEAAARGICPVLWDTSGKFYDRRQARMTDRLLRELLFAGAEQTYA